jgi:hypothetical protein
MELGNGVATKNIEKKEANRDFFFDRIFCMHAFWVDRWR